MKPGARRLVWLGGVACAGAIVFAVSGWRAEGAAAPQQKSASTPAPSKVSVGPADPPRPASTPTTAIPAMPASGAIPRPPPDVSRMQREIQIAVSSDQRGKAGEAAWHIRACENVERLRAEVDAGWHRKCEADGCALLAGMQQDLASCQAVDAASRAQLVPLLRRSLAEGDQGAAAALVSALGKGFDVASEPTVVAALRRDAWACDRVSQHWLSMLAAQHPRLLTPNEIGALREEQRAAISKATEQARRRPDSHSAHIAALESWLASFKPPPGADPAEVARMSAEIQGRCEAARAASPGGARPGVPN